MQARARRSDPGTSHDAARLIEGSGKAAVNRRILLERIRSLGGEWTAAELARFCDMDRHEASRRLPELREGGFIKNGSSPKRCTLQNTMGMTWQEDLDEDPQQELPHMPRPDYR